MWWRICTGGDDRRKANHVSFESWFHCFTAEDRVNKEQRGRNKPLVQTLNGLQVVPDDVYGSFARIGKATNTISVSWSVNLATSRRTNVRVSSLLADCLQCNGCFSLESDHSRKDWGRKNSGGAVTLPTPKIGEHSHNSVCWVGDSIARYDDRIL